MTLWGKIKATATALSFVHKDRYQTESKDIKKATQARTTASNVSPKTAVTLTCISFLSPPINASAKRKKRGMGGRGEAGEEREGKGKEGKGREIREHPLQEFPLVHPLHTECF